MKKIISTLVCLFIVSPTESLSKEYRFDIEHHIDGDKYNVFNADITPPGNYMVDYYVNSEFVGAGEIYFRYIDNKLTPCVTKESLLAQGVIKGEVDEMLFDNEQCLEFNERISFSYNQATQILKLIIDDRILKKENDGIEDISLWDDGITAILLNYRTNYLKKSVGGKESLFGQIEPGINFGAWRLRNMISWRKTSKENEIESAYTYIERGIPSLKSRLVIGDKYTESDAFESIPFRGISLRSDENMIPYSMRSYIPAITGIAKTQAQVEVRQGGYLVYTTTVAPGPFEIKDSSLIKTWGGEFTVKIIEANGEIQSYIIPYSQPFFSLGEGYLRYNISAGDYRSSDSYVENNKFIEGSVSYGFPWGVSAFSGLQVAKNYNSLSLGFGKDFGAIGSVSVDWKSSSSKTNNEKNYSHGDAFGINYNKSIDSTSTNLNLSSYYFYSKNYKSLSETFDTYSSREFTSISPRKNNLTISVNQGLGDYGSLYLGLYRDTYWNGHNEDSISARYNKLLGFSSVSLAYTKSRLKNDNNYRYDNIFSMTVSVPLGSISKNATYARYQFSSSDGNANHEAGLAGSGLEQRLSWDVRKQIKEGDSSDTGYLAASWRGTYGKIGINYSHSNIQRTFGANISGGVIIHDRGITLGQPLANTTALVEAEGVAGARVLTLPGTYTDYRGYTPAGTLTPYRKNIISIAPETLPDDTDIRQTDVKVIPSEGAIVLAKFTTTKGANVIMNATKKDGTFLPLGTVVSLKKEKKCHSINLYCW